jgi:hypothetical protein
MATSRARGKTAIAPPAKANDPTQAAATKFRVRATRDGYYNLRYYRPGDVFTVKLSEFSEVGTHQYGWMERVDARTPEKITTSVDALRKANMNLATYGSETQPGQLTDIDNPTGAEGVLGDD